MSRRRYFEEQRSGNGAIYHCVKTEIEPGDKIRLFNLMNKVKSDTISQDKINSVLNQLREGTAFNIHTQSPVSFSFSSTSTGMNQCQYGLHLTRILQVNNRVLYTSFR